jgi:hypothetical protein
MKTYRGVDIQIHVFLTPALVRGELSASRPGRFTPRGKSPRYPLDRRLSGPQNRSLRRGASTGTRTPTPQPNNLCLIGQVMFMMFFVLTQSSQPVWLIYAPKYALDCEVHQNWTQQSPWQTDNCSTVQEMSVFYGILRSLPWSQKSANAPYPEPPQSSQQSTSASSFSYYFNTWEQSPEWSLQLNVLPISNPPGCHELLIFN